MTAKKRVLLGRIVAAHGLKGEVIVHAFTGDPADIAAYGALTDAEGARELVLSIQRVTDKGVVARIAGVADRTLAEAMKGVELWVERARLPEAEAGAFYHADLVGLAAVAPDGTAVGEVVAVQNYGAGDLLEIRLAGRARTELVPFADPFVTEVDVAGGWIVVVMPE